MTAPTFVALLDVIGYKKKIEDDRHSGEETFKTQLENSLAVLKGLNEAEFSYQAISDTLIIATPPTSPFIELLDALKRVHKSFLTNGLLLRGGVAFAPHFRAGQLTYSHALPVAYQLEQQQAIYPRIVIDSNIIDLFARDGKLYGERTQISEKKLICVENGIYFVNVAGGHVEEYYDLAKSLYESEKRSLDGHEHELAKHRWLQNYVLRLSTNELPPYIDQIDVWTAPEEQP